MSQTFPQDPNAVAAAIRARATFKVLATPETRATFTEEAAARNREIVLEAVRIAGWAPFHHDRKAAAHSAVQPGETQTPALAEPWRAYVLEHRACQALADRLSTWAPDTKPTSKVPRMLYACGALVVVTWLPQFYSESDRKPAQVIVDEEHLAAASAMVQNLLLLLTAHGMGTYWSSGGAMREAGFYQEIGIPESERFLAAVFVEYPETLDNDWDRLPGKHRERRSDRWIREVAL